MNFVVLQFPASNCDQDAVHAARVLGHSARLLWHKESSLGDADAVIVPGGFSYGDYLRCGAIARFSPVMQAVKQFAENGGLVLGICNGFQVLCEAGLLPGALTRNSHLHFRNRDQALRVERADTAWTGDYEQGQRIVVPVKNGEGRYVAAPAELERLEKDGRVAVRYVDGNPNGSLRDIAGVCNAEGNVFGLMPHPEHAVNELTGGSTDGLCIFSSMRLAVEGVPA